MESNLGPAVLLRKQRTLSQNVSNEERPDGKRETVLVHFISVPRINVLLSLWYCPRPVGHIFDVLQRDRCLRVERLRQKIGCEVTPAPNDSNRRVHQLSRA